MFLSKLDLSKCNEIILTHFSEHYVVDLLNTEEMQKWYKYSYSGIIVNVHDEHTMHSCELSLLIVPHLTHFHIIISCHTYFVLYPFDS